MVNLDPFVSPLARAELLEKYDAILDSWPTPYEERDVRTAFGTTHVIVSGATAAPPLVLLHGAATTATMWSPMIEALSAAYRCYCVDTITEGNKSVNTRRLRGVADHVEWLSQTLVGLDIERTRVAGLSYGGWLAANMAVHVPSSIDKLVLLCPAATLAPLVPEFFVRMFTAGLLKSAELSRRAMQWLSATPDAPSNPIIDVVVTTLLTTRTMRVTTAFPTVLNDRDLRRIGSRTTVIVGDQEVIYRGGAEAALERARLLIPDVETCLLSDAGHALMVDCPDRVAAAVLAALA